MCQLRWARWSSVSLTESEQVSVVRAPCGLFVLIAWLGQACVQFNRGKFQEALTMYKVRLTTCWAQAHNLFSSRFGLDASPVLITALVLESIANTSSMSSLCEAWNGTLPAPAWPANESPSGV